METNLLDRSISEASQDEMPMESHEHEADTATLGIEGMTCASCVVRVERALKRSPGVLDASVNLGTERATVRFDPALASRSSLVEVVERAGYGVRGSEISLTVRGMTCANCVNRVERALKKVEGVLDANVNLATERATVVYVPGLVDPAQLKAAVVGAGYDVLDVADDRERTDYEREARRTELSRLRRELIVAASAALPLMLLDMVPMLVPPVHEWLHGVVSMGTLHYLFFLLATIVQIGPGLRFYRAGWASIRHGSPDMNALVMIGTSAAYGYSLVSTFLPMLLPAGTVHVYYEASASIITLVLLGKYLESIAKGRTSEAIRKLMNLQARTARVLRAGREIDLPIEEVVVGDIVLVRPGERVPVDGVVLDGVSYIDESMVTGESVPVLKEAGAEVIGGTVNSTGSFTVTVSTVGSGTMLARIIRMVEDAQGAKPPIQALADRVVALFVPVVLIVALGTFVVWLLWGPDPALSFAMVNAVAVLIIACPCAMGLATPTSIMVGTGKAAELGILFRKGDALQTLQDVRVIAFDKTGTLTLGRPDLTDFVTAEGFDRHEVLGAIASLERRSEHPIARAIVEGAERRGIALASVQEFDAIPGFGITGSVDGRHLSVGADRYMESLGIDVGPFAEIAVRLAEEGKSPVYAAVDGRPAAVLGVADPIKPSTPTAIAALHQLGFRVAMITGDNRRTADAIARQLRIDEVLAEVLPDGKVDAVGRLQGEGVRVAFVGDGINDAPALARADVGLAIGTGTDIAIEAADVVLMSGDLRGIPTAISLSKATLRNIRQNLFWAFAYNIVLIPVAAGALYPLAGVLLSPVIAAAAMGVSSVFVLTNALRLKSFKPLL